MWTKHIIWCGHETSPSAAYLFVERELARIIPSVLLLTATSEQLGQESHFARLRLLDPERFFDYQTFCEEQEHYQPVVNAVESLLANKALNAVEKIIFPDLLLEQDVEPLLKQLHQIMMKNNSVPVGSDSSLN